jgi:ZIP family zinc transporter
MTSFANLGPVAQALVATVYTCAMTGLGAAFVFMRREPNRKSLDGMLGSAAMFVAVRMTASFRLTMRPRLLILTRLVARGYAVGVSRYDFRRKKLDDGLLRDRF